MYIFVGIFFIFNLRSWKKTERKKKNVIISLGKNRVFLKIEVVVMLVVVGAVVGAVSFYTR